MTKGLKHFSCEEKLRHLGVFILEKRRVSECLINVHEYLNREHEEDGVRFFSGIPRDRNRGHGHKPKRRRLPLNIRNIFKVLVTKYTNTDCLETL